MKASLATAILLLAFAAPRASAQGQNTGAFQCIATATDNGKTTIFITEMIPGAPNQKTALTNAWSAFVRGAYPQQTISTTICNPGSADPAIQQRVLATEQNAWQKSGMNVVQVNWNGSSQQQGRQGSNPKTNPYADNGPAKDDKADAPADKPADDAAPPAPSGPPPRASYCYSDEKKPTIYLSDPFDTADLPSATTWQKAFSAMLLQKYMYKGIVTCKNSGTIVDAQSAILKQREGWGDGKQIVETDWTYEPPAAAPQN